MLVAHKFLFVLFVIFLDFRPGHGNLRTHFLSNHALGHDLIPDLRPDILERHAVRLFAQPFVKLVGIGDLALQLDLGEAFGDLGIHADVEILAALHQQQLVDLIAQRVFFLVLQRFIQLSAF